MDSTDFWTRFVEAAGPRDGEALMRQLRDTARAEHVDVLEWRFDPLQVELAELAVHRLGATSTRYVVDPDEVVTDGMPADRLVAEWWIETPHVERRLAARSGLVARSADVAIAPVVIPVTTSGPWVECGDVAVDRDVRRVRIPVPPRFGEMHCDAPDLALRWRLATREAFTAYFSRDYRVVDFLGDAYLLARQA
jgi:predicted GNAT superfamily acetyltransferase